MKLSELRSAIRSNSGNPLVEIPLGDISVVVPVQKTAFDKALAAAFDGQRSAETGITFDASTNQVRAIGNKAPAPQAMDGLDLDGLDLDGFDLDDEAPAIDI